MPRAAKPKTSLAEAEAHLAMVTAKLKSAEDAKVPPEQLTALIREKRMANGAVARLRGDVQRINERTIARTPAWRRMASATICALAPFPDALRAVLKAWKDLDATDL